MMKGEKVELKVLKLYYRPHDYPKLEVKDSLLR